MKRRYRGHKVDIRMTRDEHKLEQFLNSLEGEVVAIIPNVIGIAGPIRVDFLFIVEKLG